MWIWGRSACGMPAIHPRLARHLHKIFPRPSLSTLYETPKTCDKGLYILFFRVHGTSELSGVGLALLFLLPLMLRLGSFSLLFGETLNPEPLNP